MRKQIEILRNIFVCDQRDILPDRKSDENFTQHYYFSVGYNGFLHFFFEKWTFRQDAPVIFSDLCRADRSKYQCADTGDL